MSAGIGTPGKSRRKSALVNAAQKQRAYSIGAPVNLNCLVRVFFLDGSSKVLQMFENSTARELLLQLKYNLDLQDISTYAIFSVIDHLVRRVDLSEQLRDCMHDPTGAGREVRLLFRSWITYKYGGYEQEVFQTFQRVKQPNSALWLAYMEAIFMCMTGKYYLTEDESLLLGCLKMQAESGDFKPSVHSIQSMKERVASRFPNPVRGKMKALLSPTLSGSGLADDLAVRVQSIYARIAGKTKLEAQIDFLNTLRMWCPFYGSTFYDVQCQYDHNPLDNDSTPPVLMMTAAIGPLAVFLVTPSDPPVIMRHPYKRIIKWITYPDKHIFAYWVIKSDVSLSDIEEYQESLQGDFDARPFCDCVYLVTNQVKELEYLVHSYIQTRRDIPPCLPGAPEELQSPSVHMVASSLANVSIAENTPSSAAAAAAAAESTRRASKDSTGTRDGSSQGEAASSPQKSLEKTGRRASRLSVFFNALGSGASESGRAKDANGSVEVTSGSGIECSMDASGGFDTSEERFGDDTARVGTSVFRNIYKSKDGDDEVDDDDADDSFGKIPSSVQYASNMSELQRLANQESFSDDEGEGNDDDDDGSDEDQPGHAHHKKNVDKLCSTSAPSKSAQHPPRDKAKRGSIFKSMMSGKGKTKKRKDGESDDDGDAGDSSDAASDDDDDDDGATEKGSDADADAAAAAAREQTHSGEGKGAAPGDSSAKRGSIVRRASNFLFSKKLSEAELSHAAEGGANGAADSDDSSSGAGTDDD